MVQPLAYRYFFRITPYFIVHFIVHFIVYFIVTPSVIVHFIVYFIVTPSVIVYFIVHFNVTPNKFIVTRLLFIVTSVAIVTGLGAMLGHFGGTSGRVLVGFGTFFWSGYSIAESAVSLPEIIGQFRRGAFEFNALALLPFKKESYLSCRQLHSKINSPSPAACSWDRGRRSSWGRQPLPSCRDQAYRDRR